MTIAQLFVICCMENLTSDETATHTSLGFMGG